LQTILRSSSSCIIPSKNNSNENHVATITRRFCKGQRAFPLSREWSSHTQCPTWFMSFLCANAHQPPLNPQTGQQHGCVLQRTEPNRPCAFVIRYARARTNRKKFLRVPIVFSSSFGDFDSWGVRILSRKPLDPSNQSVPARADIRNGWNASRAN
jgi:hypothetical protein